MANEINKQHVYREYEKIHEWYEQSRTKLSNWSIKMLITKPSRKKAII